MATLRDILGLMEPYQHVKIYTQVGCDGDVPIITEYDSSEVQNIISMPIADKEVVLIASNPFHSHEICITVRERVM